MLNLYDVIYAQISSITDVYADQYPVDKLAQEENIVYPYATFSFPNVLINNEWSDNNIMYIDIWDNKSGQVEEIETITDSIYKALNRVKIMTEDMFIQIYRDNPFRLRLTDPDINIQHRQLHFIVKVYPKN